MIKIVCIVVSLTLCLTGCGGGSGNKSTSNLSNVTTSVAISSVATSSAEASSLSLSSSSSSIGAQSSNAAPAIASVFTVSNKTLTAPIFQTTAAPLSVQAGESFTLKWTAYSTEGELIEPSWTQVAGPTVAISSGQNTLSITAGSIGEIAIEGRISDKAGTVAIEQIKFTVTPPFSTQAKLLQGNSSGKGIDLVIVGDGFLAEDQQRLEDAAHDILNYVFEYDNETLSRYKSLFNIWLVESISTTRNIPQNGREGSTLFGAFFGCADIARLLCVNDQKVIDRVAGIVPQYDQILVLVNSNIYGGAGGQVATASLNAAVKNVALHELGHSVVRLADEYSNENSGSYSAQEPVEVNVTANPNPSTVKWNYWFENANSIPGFNKYSYSNYEVGHFQGGYYFDAGIWRPTYESIMRVLDAPFGNVNREAWALAIWRYYPSDVVFLPDVDTLPVTHTPMIFSAPLTIDASNTRISWWINDVKVNAESQFLILTDIDESIHSVKVSVEDNTQFIRRDVNGVSKLQNSWSIQ